MAFALEMYPWTCTAKHVEKNEWSVAWAMKPHWGISTESALPEVQRERILTRRNSFPDLPLINYTTQYGIGCFEGLKAFPQPDGGLKLFRPEENAKRMQLSMRGLMMPGFPTQLFVDVVKHLTSRNQQEEFTPIYDPIWEKDHFLSAPAVYIRPFAYSEAGIGLNLSEHPWVVFICTTVSAYFINQESAKSITSEIPRAIPGGTGSLKCIANYVVSILEKKKAETAGYMEVIFLDALKKQYVEEGSSCNIFFLLKDGTLVTPALMDTILPGITRSSVIRLAQDEGISVEERKISIDEVLSDTAECFVTGTAAGVSHISSITHKDKTATFGDGKIGDTSLHLQKRLKNIQYGMEEDRFHWMLPINENSA